MYVITPQKHVQNLASKVMACELGADLMRQEAMRSVLGLLMSPHW